MAMQPLYYPVGAVTATDVPAPTYQRIEKTGWSAVPYVAYQVASVGMLFGAMGAAAVHRGGSTTDTVKDLARGAGAGAVLGAVLGAIFTLTCDVKVTETKAVTT